MAEKRNSREPIKKKHQKAQKKRHQDAENPPPSSRQEKPLRGFFSCKQSRAAAEGSKKKKKTYKRIGCSGSLCSMRDNPGVMQRPGATPTAEEANKRRAVMGHSNSSSRSMKAPLSEINGVVVSTTSSSHSSSSVGGSFRGLHLRRFSGCYECHMVVDPISGVSRVPSLRASIFPCTYCGEIFMKSEGLELHQQLRHAVSELGPEDTSRNIVEIIFQSSWLKKQAPVCKIDRILKVHNTQKTISRFEDYRDSIKVKATKLPKKHPRCIADGNELLRFHCTNLLCSLGLNGSTHLCDSIPHCTVCSIIRDGFKTDPNGKIRAMATSGRAHDAAKIPQEDEKRAMLVCRVIAGRVKRGQDGSEEYDSVSGTIGPHSSLDELLLLNPKAILPCFVVIYRGF